LLTAVLSGTTVGAGALTAADTPIDDINAIPIRIKRIKKIREVSGMEMTLMNKFCFK